ncbi:MAG: 23S rRNA (pseudouridine1915-N3)-methyltransferase [Candidatus Azotimanducaceae bacterium]|jgi:23S rRNA (pseudouridine1915-N3)-methyltransferase|tara:strand:- start:859 stop:1323 length:465 start_codon:yes stop_codon:yes gene_type:complete
MKIRILSIGNKCPGWIKTGFDEYAKRMPREMPLTLLEMQAPRHHTDPAKYQQAEAQKLLAQISKNDWVIALDEHGASCTSVALAAGLKEWQMAGRDVAFLVGGADGLAKDVLSRADQKMSLSNLTFPHYMVRVILAEAVYRAWSISTGHPYHRV